MIKEEKFRFPGFSTAGAPLLVLLLSLAVTGCVSSGTYQTAVQEKEALAQKADALAGKCTQLEGEKAQLMAEKSRLEDEKNAAMGKISVLETEKSQLQQQTRQTEEEKARMAAAVQAAKAEVARQQTTFDSLRSQFSEEMKSNQVKIEMLKSGIKVNLAQEVLFPSGSARLNESGEAILRKIAGDLKEGTYQLVVAGFTDNIAISPSLVEKYPSNWELAGFRAASVVRLLEQEGVPPERMVATSFGQNSPVAGNDTPEGRAQNRRIEISLRPVEVETAQP